MNQKAKSSPTTNQIKQLNFKVSPDFYWKLKNFAPTKRLKMAEFLERAFKFYEQREKILHELNTYRQTLPRIEEQMQTFQGKMSLTELETKMSNLHPEFFHKIGLTTTYRVLKETLMECLNLSKASRLNC